MIVNLLINLLVLILGAIFSWLPQVTTLPEIVGFDLDGALVTGIGQFRQVTTAFWPIEIMFNGFMFLMGYYLIKMAITFFFGHRAPGGK